MTTTDTTRAGAVDPSSRRPTAKPSSANTRRFGRYGHLRRRLVIAQAVAWLGLPFVRIGGESALRVDIPTLSIHFFGGRIWFDELFIVFALMLFAVFTFAAVTFMYGRVWCGYACPQSALLDLTGFLAKPVGKRRRKRRHERLRRALGAVAAAAGSLLVGANLVWYFISPYDFFAQVAAGELHGFAVASMGIVAAVVFADLVWVRHSFCETICPYGRLQGILFDESTLVVAFDRPREDQCTKCEACVRVCPVNVDLRKGLSDSCVACGLCVDACVRVLERKGRAATMDYFYGEPTATVAKRSASPWRTAVIASSAGALAFLGLFVFLVATREPVGMTIMPDQEMPASMADGRLSNTYVVAFENRQDTSVVLELQVDAGAHDGVVRPSEVTLEPGAYRRVSLRVELATSDPGPHAATLIGHILGTDDGISGSLQVRGPDAWGSDGRSEPRSEPAMVDAGSN